MKDRWIVSSLMSGAVAMLILGSYAKQQKAEAVTQQEEHQTYKLAAGAHIDVSNISGPVSIEPTNDLSAEVHIYRTATNPDDLVYRKVFVEQTSSGLTIRQPNETNAVELTNRITLKLPHQVSVSEKSIGGSVNISGIDGAVDLDRISGSVTAMNLNGGALSVSGVSGNVRIAVTRINDAGVRVSNVSGSIYLRLASDLNAELSVGNTNGGVRNQIQGLALALISTGPPAYSGRLGTGGPRIVVSNVTGAIVLQGI